MYVLSLLLLSASVPTDSGVYHGRQNQLAVAVPRLEGTVAIDGALTEAEWTRASLLTGFSQFSPVDGRPADDSTDVLIWYSSTAIHFGIRAYEAHGDVRATLADRDRISADDRVEILLGTFDDGRHATVFGVNPFGIQADGILIETGATQGGGFTGATIVRESADLSPDFVFESKGRLTSYGYEVELRIPFKSLRYQPKAEQQWRINIVRRVQHSGHEDTWAPARRAHASFLGQSGRLVGLTDLRRGLVLDLNPEITASATGAPDASGWTYAHQREMGGNVRWGVTNNLTLNGAVNPDFSQVEADAGQVSFDPRQALFFPEKRPFFLDGIEQFSVPSRLIHTRRIVQPVAAAKLTGKIAGTDIALLSALDDRHVARTVDDPLFAILRVQRDLGAQSRIGVAYTDRTVGADYNRVVDVDGRFVVARLYTAQFQLARSMTGAGEMRAEAPLWHLRLARNGRTFGFRYSINGIDPDFRTHSGFISRPGIVNSVLSHHVTWYGAPGERIESLTGEVVLNGTWQYDTFTRQGDAQDKKVHLNVNSVLRGGWRAGGSVLVETFGFDQALYADYAIELPRADGSGADTVPFSGTPRLPNLDYVVSLGTPEFAHGSASAFFVWGRDENFFEWASADILYATLSADWRPTEKVRVNAAYQHQQFDRRTDGSTVGRRRIPRLKLEYQLSRPVFVRLLAEYDARYQDDLRDDSRTNAPLLLRDPATGLYGRADGWSENTLRADVLFSYQPSPGSVFFAGYGSTMGEADALRFGRLRRTHDAVFVKLSYLLRM